MAVYEATGGVVLRDLLDVRARPGSAVTLRRVNDVVVMPINAFLLATHLPNAQLITYPDTSHGAQSQTPRYFWSMQGCF